MSFAPLPATGRCSRQTWRKKARDALEAPCGDRPGTDVLHRRHGRIRQPLRRGGCAACARSWKARIRLYLVRPYLTAEIQPPGAYYEATFDGVFIAPELLGLHYKRHMHRNRWMVDRAQVLLSYVTRDFGGASARLRYAKHAPGLRIIDLAGA